MTEAETRERQRQRPARDRDRETETQRPERQGQRQTETRETGTEPDRARERLRETETRGAPALGEENERKRKGQTLAALPGGMRFKVGCRCQQAAHVAASTHCSALGAPPALVTSARWQSLQPRNEAMGDVTRRY